MRVDEGLNVDDLGEVRRSCPPGGPRAVHANRILSNLWEDNDVIRADPSPVMETPERRAFYERIADRT